MNAPKLSLTVAIIARNAALQLGPCLASVAFADETLVLDSGSTDDTIAVARAHGARVETGEWLGFGRQKQHAVGLARHDWVLCLDADERVSERLESSIREAMAGPRYHAWRMTRRNRFLGRWLAHGEGYPDWTLRFFHRAHASWSNDEVHEAVLTTAEVGRLEGDLLHESADDIATYVAKQNRYTTLHAQALYEQGVRAGYWRLVASPVVRFLKFYFLRLGLLDGGAGFAHIAIGCNSAFLKYLKLIELERSASPAARRTP
ncbi:MAG TPA: glycosyltransferase family 2 protein [Usitatibacter sp.]|jgi:glycosyltransferase involved in cell wall biosynthesis|nr:glycosyltransferase family 2 protein [Usitatibacter sp.]